MEEEFIVWCDEERELVVLKTPRGECSIALKNFEIFCQRGQVLVSHIHNESWCKKITTQSDGEELIAKWDDGRKLIMLITFRGEYPLALEDFSIFCQKGSALALGCYNTRKIKQFIAQLMKKRLEETGPIEDSEIQKILNEAEKFLAQPK